MAPAGGCLSGARKASSREVFAGEFYGILDGSAGGTYTVVFLGMRPFPRVMHSKSRESGGRDIPTAHGRHGMYVHT